MQKKYFKCYFCKTGNSYFVPKEEKGKYCRYCLAYNYFFDNNSKKYKKKYNNHYNNNNYYCNNKRKRHYINNNNNDRKRNNNYQNSSNNKNNIIPNIPSNNNPLNQIPILFPLIPIINPLTNNNQNQLTFPYPFPFYPRPIFFNNVFPIKKEEKKEEFNKYKWLKKEKLTEEMIENNKDGIECSICLENIKINEVINILKCGHIFHYKCMEELVDHKDDKCPNCRCDLKTGEKQKIRDSSPFDLIMNDIYEEELLDDYLFDDDRDNVHNIEEVDDNDDEEQFV